MPEVAAPERGSEAEWVRRHLGEILRDDVAPSPIAGGQRAADEALAAFHVRGYSARRNEVWPVDRRGAWRRRDRRGAR